MGMVIGLVALRDEDIERIHADPPLVWLVVAPDDPEAYEQERAKSKGLFSKLFGKKAAAETPTIEILGECDLDKAWDGVSYLLTGKSCATFGTVPAGHLSAEDSGFPLNFLIRDSRLVGDIEVGYGQARTFSSAEMRAVHEAMKPFTDEVLMLRYNAADMTAQKVYLEMWDGESEPEMRQWLVDLTKDLRSFVADCAAKNCGCLIYMT